MGRAVVATFRAGGNPLDAAARFHAENVPMARKMLSGTFELPGGERLEAADSLVFVFPPAGHEHHGWRLAAIQALAREAAPKRVNAVVGDDLDAVDRTTEWLADSLGITGQLLTV